MFFCVSDKPTIQNNVPGKFDDICPPFYHFSAENPFGEVFVLIVVVAVLCRNANDGQGIGLATCAEYRASYFVAINELLAQNIGITKNRRMFSQQHPS